MLAKIGWCGRCQPLSLTFMYEPATSPAPGAPPENNIYRRVWQLAAPMILANLTVPLPGIVDTAVMGRLDEPYYLGALGIGASIFMIIYYAFGFLRMGTAGFAAQAFGAGNVTEILASLVRALALGVVLGVFLISIHNIIGQIAFALIQPSAIHEQFATVYFQTRIWGAPAAMANFAVLGWLVAMQRARDALVMQLFLNGLNISLDFIFVYGLSMTIDGVALATVIADYAALVPGFYFVVRRLADFDIGPSQAIHLRRHILDRFAMTQLFRVNGDIFIRTAFLTVSFAILPAIGARIGQRILDANTVLFNLVGFLAYGLDAFAYAAEALVGKAKGARDRDGFRASALASTYFAIGFSVLYAVAYALLGGHIVDLLTEHEAVRQEAYQYLPWIIACPLVAVWCFQLDGIFIGSTRSTDLRNMMAISFAIYIVALWYLVPRLGNHGLWLSLLIFFAARGITLGLRYPALERSVNPQQRPATE